MALRRFLTKYYIFVNIIFCRIVYTAHDLHLVLLLLENQERQLSLLQYNYVMDLVENPSQQYHKSCVTEFCIDL